MVTLLFHYIYDMATSQKLLTEKVFKGYMKQYVTRKELKASAKKFATKKVFNNFSKKVFKKFNDHDEEFKSIDRNLKSMSGRISNLAAEMHQSFDTLRDELHQFRQDVDQKFSLRLSEIR